MSRLHFMGGAWTNAEDQVLEAALDKYGLRDWERVASMIPQKNATQCRERWESYLDHRLNLKEEWSPEEEEKLVELQTLFPNKWRMISEQLTRTTSTHFRRPPWLCEQRYQEMRAAQEYENRQAQSSGQPQQTLQEFLAERRRRNAGRQAHEEKAARADTISGGRFEKEMLDMAVSRLANQDQKKGLRKERQRLQAEATFLAKLENTRESTESGTLSERQRKRMLKALEEDRRGQTALLDQIAEGEGDDDGEGEEYDENDDEDGVPRARKTKKFESVDMLEDQAKAGIGKKQRALVVDLSKQQAAAALRLEESGAVKGVSTVTGVNHDLLRQLTAIGTGAPGDSGGRQHAASIEGGGARTAITMGSSTISTAATTWDALVGPEAAPDLDNLFAALPEVMPKAGAEGEEQAGKGTEVDLNAFFDVPASTATGQERKGEETTAKVMGETSASGVSRKRERSSSSQRPKSRSATPSREKKATAVPSQPAALLNLSSAERKGLLEKARQTVAIEAERLCIQAERPLLADEDGEEESQPTESELAAARARVETALQSSSSSSSAGAQADQKSVDDAEQDAEQVAAAVDSLQYWTHVSAGAAIRELEARVTTMVEEINQKMRAMRARVGQIAAQCFMAPQDHILGAYVSHGHLITRGGKAGREEAATGEGSDERIENGNVKNGSNEDCDSDSSRNSGVGGGDAIVFSSSFPSSLRASPSVSSEALLLCYLWEHWTGKLDFLQRHAQFLEQLRAEEHTVMRQRLDEARAELKELQAKEKQLQAMYRQSQLEKQSCVGLKG